MEEVAKINNVVNTQVNLNKMSFKNKTTHYLWFKTYVGLKYIKTTV